MKGLEPLQIASKSTALPIKLHSIDNTKIIEN